MKLICFATFEEAKATLELFEAQPVANGLYSSSRALFAITGIGSFASHVVTLALSENVEAIVNIGLAGSYRKELEIGSIHPINRCTKFLWHPKGKEASQACVAQGFAPLTLAKEGLHLCTVDFPQYAVSDEERTEFDLVDMEGYGVAFTAEMKGIKCELYKIVSDHCTKKTASQIKERLPYLSEQMAQFLLANVLK